MGKFSDYLKGTIWLASNNLYEYYPNDYSQDSSKSIINRENMYDLTRFSTHEDQIIKQVLCITKQKYPEKYQAIGLANESYTVIYKPRYILFEIIVLLYSGSKKPLDMMAVAFAYESKGAAFRQDAISFFEKAMRNINFHELDKFASVSTDAIFLKFSTVYEREHEYEKAIKCLQNASKHGRVSKIYCKEQIDKLKIKMATAKPLRKRKISDSQVEFENNLRIAALKYIEN